MPGAEVVQELSKALGVTVSWLVSGEGPMTLEGQGGGAGEAPETAELVARQAPPLALSGEAFVVYDRVPHGHGAGDGRDNEAAEPDTVTLPASYVRRLFGRVPRRGEVYLSRVYGDSMEPWLAQDEDVWIEVCQGFESGDGRYALRYDGSGEEVIKRVQVLGRGRIRVKSDNKRYDPLDYELVEGETYREMQTGATHEIHVQGRVIRPTDRPVATHYELVASLREIMGAR